MSEPPTQGSGSQPVPQCHEQPPEYYPAQPSQDTLASIIENEHALRTLQQKLDEMLDEGADSEGPEEIPTGLDFLQKAELSQVFGEMSIEEGQTFSEMAKVLRERANQKWNGLYNALAKLTDDEFNEAYASLKQNPTQQIQHALD